MILEILVLVFGTILAAIYLFYKKSFKYWEKLGFPHTNPTFPFGDVSGATTSVTIGEVISKVYKKFPSERFVGMWFLFRPSLLIRDPELIKTIFVREFMKFHDRGINVNEKDDPLAAHLFAIGGTKWRNLRVKLTPTFTSGKMKMMFPILTECSKNFRNVLEGPASRGEVVDVKDYAARFTTDIISLAAFGLETDSLNHPDAEFRHNGQQIFEPTLMETIKFILQNFVPNMGKYFEVTTIRKSVSDFFIKAFRDNMEYRDKNNIKRNDFFDLLIQLKNKGKLDDVDGDTKEERKFTLEEACAQAFIFFLAGFETSSTTMQFAMYELAKNPEIQQKVRKEIKEVLARHGGEISYESVGEMDFLGRVIDETLRMYPALPFLQRECNQEFQIPDSELKIPEGVQCIIDVLGLHRDPQHYPNPEIFDPNRFTEEEKAKRHHYAYLPFGEGPRNCIGMRFGLLQTRVGLLTLLNDYELSVAKETLVPIKLDPKGIIIAALGGMPLRINNIKST